MMRIVHIEARTIRARLRMWKAWQDWCLAEEHSGQIVFRPEAEDIEDFGLSQTSKSGPRSAYDGLLWCSKYLKSGHDFAEVTKPGKRHAG